MKANKWLIALLGLLLSGCENVLYDNNTDGFFIKLSDNNLGDKIISDSAIDCYDFSTHTVYSKEYPSFLKELTSGIVKVYAGGR
ncbi:MAG: hypothetical protein LBH19_09950 [Dysgonamonadaceae bacterium]|jgi:hypothetical protein|nr:hypothetical protein [Dysgonamonadaceae bacterium]